MEKPDLCECAAVCSESLKNGCEPLCRPHENGQWVSIKDRLPEKIFTETSYYVWVTDGILIEIAQYIHRPRNYGCCIKDDDEDPHISICPAYPHWHFEEGGSFRDGDRCFGYIESSEITHWMALPKPPRNENGMD